MSRGHQAHRSIPDLIYPGDEISASGDVAASMRVCHFSATALDGHYFENVARGLSASGVQVMLGTLGNAGLPGWWRDDIPGVDYFSLGFASRARYPFAVFRLASLLRRWRVEILQTHLFDGAAVGIPAARLARVPLLIVTRHHHDQHWLLRRPLHVRIDRVMASLADQVIVPSAAVRELMVSREHVDGSRVHVIHLGVDPDQFNFAAPAGRRVREELGLGANDFVIGSVGRIVPGKGLQDLLAAARSLRETIEHLRIVIVGDHPDGANRRALIHDAEHLGLADTVLFLGHREDVPACMDAMDVLAHPSHSEALPQVVIEAMAAGLPVVATDVGGIPELVEDGRTGVLVPPHDPNALAQALRALYSDVQLRQSLSRESVRVVQQHFTADRMVKDHLERYRQWLKLQQRRDPLEKPQRNTA